MGDSPGMFGIEHLNSKSGEEGRLCPRCEKANFGVFPDIPDTLIAKVPIRYEPQLLESSCIICKQLAPIIEGFKLGRVFHNPNRNEDNGEIQDKGILVSWSTFTSVPTLRLEWNSKVANYHCTTDLMHPDHGLGSGMLPQTNKRNTVDFGRIRLWLDHCETNHRETCCMKDTGETMKNMRVIDCNTRELCNLPPHCVYIALSYTWGKASSHDAIVRGRLPSILPQTIEDSINVASTLGVPYLWIDRYCIDQDNSEEKHDIIRRMNEIYSGAYLTIIAAAGAGPNHGLPGVGDTPRWPHYYITIGFHQFTELDSTREQIKHSTWMTRGWTYQEMVLSRRRLVFTEGGVYFQCRVMTCFERVPFPTPRHLLSKRFGGLFPDWFPEFRGLFPDIGLDTDSDIRNHVALYGQIKQFWLRELGFEEDRLNAFEGIFAAYQEMSSKIEVGIQNEKASYERYRGHFWGIPLYSDPEKFNATPGTVGFLWKKDERSKPNSKFPSWTWAAHTSLKSSKELYFPLGISKDRMATSTYIRVTHRSGKVVDLSNFMKISPNYKEFYPYIDIDCWSIWSSLTLNVPIAHRHKVQYNPGRVGKLIGDWNGNFLPPCREHLEEDIYFDRTGDWRGKRLLAVKIQPSNPRDWINGTFRYELYCLLLEEAPSGDYRRVGRYNLSIVWPSSSEDLEEFFVKKSYEIFPGVKDQWARRIVRVI